MNATIQQQLDEQTPPILGGEKITWERPLYLVTD